MLIIKKTGEGYYLASLTAPIEKLGSRECNLIKKEIRTVLKPHREISINIKGVKSIENRGFHNLSELKHLSDASRCKLRFINVEPSLAAKITELFEKKPQQNSILEFD